LPPPVGNSAVVSAQWENAIIAESSIIEQRNASAAAIYELPLSSYYRNRQKTGWLLPPRSRRSAYGIQRICHDWRL